MGAGAFAGPIADGLHVVPTTIAIALRARKLSERVVLVTDAMSSVGSAELEFALNGWAVRRGDGALRRPDGTLTGADLTLIDAVR